MYSQTHYTVLSYTTNTTAYTPDNQHMYSQTHYTVLSYTTNTTAYTPDNQHMYSQTHYTVCVVLYHQHHGIHTCQPTHVKANTLHCLCCLLPPTPRHTHLTTNTCTVKHTTLCCLIPPTPQHTHLTTNTCTVKHTTLCCLIPPTPQHTHLTTNTCTVKHTTLSVLSYTTNTTAYTPDNQHMYSQTHYTVCVVFHHQNHSIHT